MRNLLIAGLLFFVAGCTSNEGKAGNADSTKTTQGNSGGSDIIATDTMHMDTSSKSISNK